MKFRPTATIGVLLSSTLGASCGFAAEVSSVTPEGAKQLTETLETYIGKPAAGAPSAVTVTQNGSAYQIHIDYAKIPLASDYKFKLDGHMDYAASPLPDGRWRVISQEPPAFQVKIGNFQQDIGYDKIDQNAVFDPKMRFFSEIKTKANNLISTSKSTIIQTDLPLASMPPMPTKPGDNSSQKTTIISSTAVSETSEALTTSHPSGENLIDIGVDYALKNYKLTRRASDGPMGDFTASTAQLSSSNDYRGVHWPAILDAWAFLISHNSVDALSAAQPEMKQKLRALGPIFASAAGTGSGKDFKLDTTVGSFAAKTLNVKFDSLGLVKNAKSAAELDIADITSSSEALPAWAAPLLPTDFRFSYEVNGSDLETASKLAIDALDLKSTKLIGDADLNKIIAALLPDSGAHLIIRRSELRTKIASLTMEGDFKATTKGIPAKGHIVVKNFDAVLDVLKKASSKDPLAGQALLALTAVKGFGKQGPDGTMIWDLAGDESGKVTVNDIPIGQ